MNPFPVIFGLYPGWEGIAKHGRWRHLLVAVVFACLLDLVLLLTCYWTDFIPAGEKRWYWLALGIAWLVLAGLASQLTKRLTAIRSLDREGDLYLEVTTHYLQGNWRAAEACAKALLQHNPQDAEALLLLATLYRHVRRPLDAQLALASLKKLETADRWACEIALEEQYLHEPSESPAPPADAKTADQTEPDSDHREPHIFIG